MSAVDDVAVASGAVALQKALREKNADGVMVVLQSLNAQGVAGVLIQSGFHVSPEVLNQGSRAAIFASAREDLGAALNLGVDGFGLNATRVRPTEFGSVGQDVGGTGGFAAKGVDVSFRPDEFDGNYEAALVIQSVMRASRLDVELMGNAPASTRTSLLMVAGQALKKGVQGFGVDGVDGKYCLPLQLADLPAIYSASTVAVAQESARTGLARWSAGLPVGQLDDWVPETTQRLLASTLSLEAARSVVASLDSRSFESHAAQIGEHGFATLLKAQGLDVDAATIEEQAQSLGLVIQEPNRAKGQYFGAVVGLDHRAGLVKVARAEALELPFKDLRADQLKPVVGDDVHMAFKNGVLAVSVTEHINTRLGVGR